MRRLLAFLLTVVLTLVTWTTPVQAVPPGGNIDFQHFSYATMPNFAGANTLIVSDPDLIERLGYNLSRSWSVGTAVQDTVLLGDLYSFGVGDWTLAGIAKAQGVNLDNVSLGSFKAINAQSIASLTQAIPDLASQKVQDVPLFAALVSGGSPSGNLTQTHASGGGPTNLILTVVQKTAIARLLKRFPALQDVPLAVIMQGDWQGMLDAGAQRALQELAQRFPSLANLPIGAILEGNWSEVGGWGATKLLNLLVSDFLRQYPQLANLPFGAVLNLNQFSFTDIPGLVYTSFQSIPGLAQQPITAIPGLPNVPLADILGWSQLLQMGFARVDIPFGSQKEGQARYTLSGSTKGDVLKAVPCVGVCPNIELDNTQSIPSIDIKGRQWVTTDQQVPGGKGILGQLNQGLEPTGLTPWGPKPNLKLTLTQIDEKLGQADLALYLRFCAKTMFVDLGCTPYFMGPIPFGSVREKETVVIATTAPPPDINPPPPPPGVTPPPGPSPPPGDTPPPIPTSCDGQQRKYLRPSSGPITSDFGWRIHPITGRRKLHAGIDIGTPSGGNIYAADCGRVSYAGWASGYGNYTCIVHKSGQETCYAHQSRIGVHQGQDLQRGEIIGAVGSTGGSTGPHLHFEVRLGAGGQPINPYPLVAW